MKRAEWLIPLSHNHHGGLVFARRLRIAIENETEPLASLVEKFRALWDDDLNAHFAAEEELVIPPLRRAGITSCDDVIDRMFEEHRTLRGLRDAIYAEEDPEQQKELLLRFSELLTAHIRFEERELFEAIQEAMPEENVPKLTTAILEAAPPARACSIEVGRLDREPEPDP